MDIGKEEDTVIVEPIEDPVPRREPASVPDENLEAPDAPEREREREPALVPSKRTAEQHIAAD